MTKKNLLFLFGAICFLFLQQAHVATSHAVHKVDLSIGWSKAWNRPAILIAWRNTFKVFEAEVLVHNYGTTAGTGIITLEIVDALGNILMSRPGKNEKIKVKIPAVNDGGKEGVIVQILGSVEANQLIDRLDRDGIQYSIRARVDSIEGDIDLTNNVAGKTYNNESKVLSGKNINYSFGVLNKSTIHKLYKIKYHFKDVPNYWKLESSNIQNEVIRINPNETVFLQHSILCKSTQEICNTPMQANVITKLIDISSGKVADIREWFVVSDVMPPKIRKKEMIIEQDGGSIHVEAVVFDRHSGIKEASGVSLEYSVDGGLTFSNKTMAYADGDFVKPTRFLADLGPFAPKTDVVIAISARDSAGNITRLKLGKVKISG